MIAGSFDELVGQSARKTSELGYRNPQVRSTEGDKGQMSIEEFIQRCEQETQTRGAATAVA